MSNHIRSHRNIVCVLSMLATVAFAGIIASGAQEKQDRPEMTVQVKVVNVPVTVRDKHGKLISNLGKDDFVLQEDGRFQDVRYFAHENDLPLTLGLLVDTSLSQRRVLSQERDASSTFMDQMLHPEKDQAFLIHFDREVELDQDVTSSREKLRSALQGLQAPQFSQTSGGNPQDRDQDSAGRRGGDGSHHGGTLLYDAIYLASDEIMKKQSNHKAIVVLSDGVDRGSKESLREAIEAAQRADTIVYSVLFKDEQQPFGGDRGGRGGWGGGWGGPMGGGGHRGGGQRYPQQARPDGKKILEQISRETGGRLFEISGKQTIDKIYAQIEEELRSQYNLGYSPDRTGGSAGYHKIELKTKQKDLVVQAREGYYAD